MPTVRGARINKATGLYGVPAAVSIDGQIELSGNGVKKKASVGK